MLRAPMRLGQDVLANLDAATAREWLLTNALGGAASGTAAGAHTRRSHAWLLAADADGRAALPLLKLEERLTVNGESLELGTNLVAAPASEVAHPPLARPAGHLLLEAFTFEPWPTWRWRAGGVTLERSLFLLHTHHAVAVTYRHLDGPPARLSAAPLLTARTPEALQPVDEGWRGVAQAVPGRVVIETSSGGTALSIWHNGTFMPARVWQRGLVYPADPDPSDTDAAFVPGYLECELAPGAAFHVVASVERDLFRALAVEGLLGAPPPGSLGECVALVERGERERLARWQRAATTGAEVTLGQAARAHRGREVTAGSGTTPPAGEASDADPAVQLHPP